MGTIGFVLILVQSRISGTKLFMLKNVSTLFLNNARYGLFSIWSMYYSIPTVCHLLAHAVMVDNQFLYDRMV